MNIGYLFTLRPQIVPVEDGPEPSLRRILQLYYEHHGFDTGMARVLVDSYCEKLQEMIQQREGCER